MTYPADWVLEYTQEQVDAMNDTEHRGLCKEIPLSGTTSICYAGLTNEELTKLYSEPLKYFNWDDFIVEFPVPVPKDERKIMVSRSDGLVATMERSKERKLRQRNFGKKILSSRD